MRRSRGRRGRLIPAFAACFAAGVFVGWWLGGGPPSPVASDFGRTTDARVGATGDEVRRKPRLDKAQGSREALERPDAANGGRGAVATSGTRGEAAIEALRRRDLRVPIDGADIDRLNGMFSEARDGRAHEAVDILAPRYTPIHAVEDGTIAKLFVSKAGGQTIYQFDPSDRFCYYYAHLERYAPGLHDGQHVARGEVIGYVGTSGNAPPNTPHLHFAVSELGPDRRWWQGRPIDPYLVLRK